MFIARCRNESVECSHMYVNGCQMYPCSKTPSTLTEASHVSGIPFEPSTNWSSHITPHAIMMRCTIGVMPRMPPPEY